MKNTAIGIAVIAALIGTPALAADMPVKAPSPPPPAPAWSWSGFYVGLDGGYGSNASTGDARSSRSGVLFGPGTFLPTGSVERPSGGLFGAEAGYNFQSGPIVYGVETDIQWSGIRGSASVPLICCNTGISPPPFLYSVSTNLDWFGTTRLRIGFLPVSPLLLYVTGGAIYGHVLLTDNEQLITYSYGPETTTSTRAGGTVGGGLEYAFNGNLSAKIEGLYYDMGTITNNAPISLPSGSPYTGGGTFAIRGAIVRGGLIYHFNGPLLPSH